VLLLCCCLAALSSEPNPFQEYTIDEIVPIRIAVRSVLNLLDDAVNTLKGSVAKFSKKSILV
jgi:hypothetical protein